MLIKCFMIGRINQQILDLDTDLSDSKSQVRAGHHASSIAIEMRKHCWNSGRQIKRYFQIFSIEFHKHLLSITVHLATHDGRYKKHGRYGVYAGRLSIRADRKNPDGSQTSKRSIWRKCVSTYKAAKLYKGMLEWVKRRKKLLWN